jgi:tRNA threonylcarbamoyladenosine modification (KEOPS) complex  Pcc1 subunit
MPTDMFGAHEAVIRIKCKRPDFVRSSLEPDIKNNEDAQTEIKSDKDFVEIKVKSKKLNHLKAIINSYISLISMLSEVEDVLAKRKESD